MVLHESKTYVRRKKRFIKFSFKDACDWTTRFLQQYANHRLDCCESSVKKYGLGTSKCYDHDMLTIHQPIRLQHFERGN